MAFDAAVAVGASNHCGCLWAHIENTAPRKLSLFISSMGHAVDGQRISMLQGILYALGLGCDWSSNKKLIQFMVTTGSKLNRKCEFSV